MAAVTSNLQPMETDMGRAVALGVFPGLRAHNGGGVQLSGVFAWRALAEFASRANGSADLLVFGDVDEAELPAAGKAFHTSSRTAVLRHALTWPRNPEVACFWHIGLLKLLPLLRRRPQRVALFLHGIEVWKRQNWFTRRLLNRVDLFLSNSQHTWNRFIDFHPRLAGRSHKVTALGVGDPTHNPTTAPDEVPAALIVARMDKDEDYKGHRELIGVWPRVLEVLPGAQLWVVGDGNLRPELERECASLNVARHVKFLGYVSEQKKEELVRRSRCLAMPSRGEGFGLVYLEAMRSGRPCLVSNCDAGAEVINSPEAGLSVDPSDPAALAGALIDLLSLGPRWEHWSRSARARFEAHFTADRFQQRFVEALFGNETERQGLCAASLES